MMMWSSDDGPPHMIMAEITNMLPPYDEANKRIIDNHLRFCLACQLWALEHGDEWAKWFWVERRDWWFWVRRD